MKSLIFAFGMLAIPLLVHSQTPEKSFDQKLDGIQTSSSELTKSASTDNSSVGQSGQMTTSVPLVTVASRTMNFPIQLNYASGIKVDQKSGPVGLGWAMPVGSIVRDYGAFEPDYSSTLHEGDMKHWDQGQTGWLNPNGGSHAINPMENNQYLGYDALVSENLRQIPLSDFYHMSVPGKGANTFWNGGTIGGTHSWNWNEFENWKVEHVVKTFEIDQEFSRINDANLDNPGIGGSGKDWFNFDESYAAAIGVLPYVKNGSALRPAAGGSSFNPSEAEKVVKYEDFETFTITDENGVRYVFGRALRGQKFVLQDDPYWSSLSNNAPNAADGSFWKIDFIAEWLLTEILSPDYEDLNANGVADDGDAGDWIRFEYTEPTKMVQTIPIGALSTARLSSEVPMHREWSSFSQTDQASSLMRERAYLTKIVTPIQELDFTISQRFDVDHDYYSKPANKIGNDYWYEDRQYGSQGTSSDLDILYPVETMKYDTIKVYSRLIDQDTYKDENLLTGAIAFNYADKGSSEELAVSEYLIRDNENNDKLIDKPSTSSAFDIESYKDNENKRGKTTLLSIDLLGGDMKDQEKTSFEFEYGYNPSYNEIHKRKIVRAYSHPSLRNSLASTGYSKSGAPIDYNEERLNSNGTTYTSVSHTGTNGKLHPNDFLITIPYEEKYYKLAFPDNNAVNAYATGQQTGTSIYSITNESIVHNLAPVQDVYGFLYADNCTVCPEAWSLTKITYPTGGQVSFDYEQGDFALNVDEPNWSVSENDVPVIKEYNELAKHRSYVQDAYNRYAANVGADGFGQNNSQYKTLTATFEVELPETYGIRLKKKTIYDRVNPQVEINYEYSDGHFTSAPAEYVQAYVGAFNQFVMRERTRHQWEEGNYGPAPGAGFITDFKNRMSHAAITDLALDEYEAVHFYEYVDEKNIDNSFSRIHYGSLDGSTNVQYIDYNVFCYRLPAAAWDGQYILARENLDQLPVMPIMTELFDANSQQPYQTTINTYSRTKLFDYELAFDYTVGTTNPNTVSMWGLLDYYNIWLPVTAGFYTSTYSYDNGFNISFPGSQSGITGFGHIQTDINSSFYLPYGGIQVFEYSRWGTYKTTLQSSVAIYKGLSTTTSYDYDQVTWVLKKTTQTGDHTNVPLITTYEYGHETYSAVVPNPFYEKNIFSALTRRNTFIEDENASNNAINAEMITYDLASYASPRPLNSYSYETDVLTTFGTFQINPFALSGPNPDWRIAQMDNIEYNKPGQLISSRTNRLFNKTVFGNNLSTVKATFSHPFMEFDATYSGFEDLINFLPLSTWNSEDYKDEDWFLEGEISVEEPAVSWRVKENPCNHTIPAGENQPLIKELNHILIDNVAGIQTGDLVEVELTGSSNSVPAYYTWKAQAVVTDIVSVPGTYSMDYAMCLSIPIQYPDGSTANNPLIGANGTGLDNTPVTITLDERAEYTIEETKVIKLGDTYQVSDRFARTGKYSYVLPTKRDANSDFKNTPIRPVKLEAPSPPTGGPACIDPSLTPLVNDDCQWSYEASVWLKMENDLTTAPGGSSSAKSADPSGDALYPDGTISTTNSSSGIKIVVDYYNGTRSSLIEQRVFYAEDVDSDWKQYTVNVPYSKGGLRWLDVYVVNEIDQSQVAIQDYKSLYVDDILVYPTDSKYSYVTYDKFGNESFVTNNDDVFAETTFDEKGRPISQKNAYGQVVSEQTYFDTPNWSNQVNHVTTRQWVKNATYNESRAYLDGFGKTKQVMLADFSRGARIVSESNYYNNRGFVTASFKPYAITGANLTDNYDLDFIFDVQDMYSSSFALIEATYESKPEMKLSTMAPPRLNSESTISASQQDYASTGAISAPYGLTLETQNYPAGTLLIHELTDANGNKTRTYMDDLGRVILEEEEIGADYIQNADGTISLTSGNALAKTWFVYDKSGKLVKVVDPSGKQTDYTYNSLGILIEKSTADQGTSQMRYDEFGQIRFTRDQKDLDANVSAFGTDQFSYTKYDEWGRAIESGQKMAASSQPPFTGVAFFDDYSKINDQDFPSSSEALVEVHIKFDFDGSRPQFNSDALLKETTLNDFVLNGSYQYVASTLDEKEYEYLADGQVAEVRYYYDGLDEHIIEYTYNELQYPIGKKYTHPNNTNYDFEWKSELDNFARPESNSAEHNGIVTQTGAYYYDVLGNLLMKGIGSTGINTDPHVDYHVFKNNIRDQLVNFTSNNFRFGLNYDVHGNILDQYWSNELLDPTTGASSTIHQYHYYYDKKDRLTGADYREGSITGNPFDYFDDIFSTIPNDFNCGVNQIAVDEYFADIISLIDNESSEGIDAINALNELNASYKGNNVAYQTMSESERDEFLDYYISIMYRKRLDPKAYEMYEAVAQEDADHKDLIGSTGDLDASMMKYTRLILIGVPYTPAVDCDPNPNATVYQFIQDFPVPGSMTNGTKYDAAYWYEENGNLTDLNRNDENGTKTEQDYTYANATKNQVTQTDFTTSGSTTQHSYTYDQLGNITSDGLVGVSAINYDAYDELPSDITNSNGTYTYRYDANGQRIAHIISSTDKEYFLDGVVVDQNGDVKSYQTPEGYAVPTGTGGISYFYYAQDWLGTTRGVMDYTGQMLNAHDHYPFGKLMPDRISVVNSEGQRYQFTGHEYDEETGYGYHGARYYNRELGRYMNVDRYAENFYEQSPYVYAGDMPVKAIDVNGDSLYVLFWVDDNVMGHNGDDDAMFRAAAWTRKRNIEKASWFDPEKDKVVVLRVHDLNNVKWQMKWAVDTYSEKYGKTKEVGIWSHAGQDGPIGSDLTGGEKGYNRIPGAGNGYQMTFDGWGKIDFNWGSSGKEIFGVYGCRSGKKDGDDPNGRPQNFTYKLSKLDNFKNVTVWGQKTSSYPSMYTNEREWDSGMASGNFKGREIYMVGSDGGAGDYIFNNAYKMTRYKNGYRKSDRYQPGRRD